jgi:hypothetical protein
MLIHLPCQQLEPWKKAYMPELLRQCTHFNLVSWFYRIDPKTLRGNQELQEYFRPLQPRGLQPLGRFVHWSLSSKFGKFGVSNFGVYGVYRPMNIQIHDFMTHETYQYPSKLPQAAQACTSSSTRACAIAGCPSDDMGCHDFSSYPKSMANIPKRTQTRWCSPII